MKSSGGGGRMVTAKKHYTRPRHKGQATVPDTLTADELQEVVSQAIWEWAVSKKLLPRTATHMPTSVLEAAFRMMALDAGKAEWMTQKARDWYMNRADEGANKLSKNQFTDGLHSVLNVRVQWANVDSLWRRVLKEYPPEPGMPAPSVFRSYDTAFDAPAGGRASSSSSSRKKGAVSAMLSRHSRPSSASSSPASSARGGGGVGSPRPFRWQPTRKTTSTVHPFSSAAPSSAFDEAKEDARVSGGGCGGGGGCWGGGNQAGGDGTQKQQPQAEARREGGEGGKGTGKGKGSVGGVEDSGVRWGNHGGEEEEEEEVDEGSSNVSSSSSLMFGVNWKGKLPKKKQMQQQLEQQKQQRMAHRQAIYSNPSPSPTSAGQGTHRRPLSAPSSGRARTNASFGGGFGFESFQPENSKGAGGWGNGNSNGNSGSGKRAAPSATSFPSPAPSPSSPRLVSATGAAGLAAAAAEAEKEALLDASAASSASHVTLHQFVTAFAPPHNDAHAQLEEQQRADRKQQLARASATAASLTAAGAVSAAGGGAAVVGGGLRELRVGHAEEHAEEGPPTTTKVRSKVRPQASPLTLRQRGGSTMWLNDAFGRVMAAIDRDGLLLHEAFFAFDINGDGVVSLGEFVRTLKRMQPPLQFHSGDGGEDGDCLADDGAQFKNRLFSMFCVVDASGGSGVREIRLPEFVAFFLTLYQQRLDSLEKALKALNRDLTIIRTDFSAATAAAAAAAAKAQSSSAVEDEDEDAVADDFPAAFTGDGSSVGGVESGGDESLGRQQQKQQQQQQRSRQQLRQQQLRQLRQQEQEQLEGDHAHVLVAMSEVKGHLKRTGMVVASACDLLANEEAARKEEAATGLSYGGAGLTSYVPATGKGGIARDLYQFGESEKKKREDKARSKKMLEGFAEEETDANVEEAEKRHERQRRTRRVNEMLCFRIYKRNQVLPIKQQILGLTYGVGSSSNFNYSSNSNKNSKNKKSTTVNTRSNDSAAVATGKFQLKLEIQARLNEEEDGDNATKRESRQRSSRLRSDKPTTNMDLHSPPSTSPLRPPPLQPSPSLTSSSTHSGPIHSGPRHQHQHHHHHHHHAHSPAGGFKSVRLRSVAGGSRSSSSSRAFPSPVLGGGCEGAMAMANLLMALPRDPSEQWEMVEDTGADLLRMGCGASVGGSSGGNGGGGGSGGKALQNKEELHAHFEVAAQESVESLDIHVMDRALQATTDAKERALSSDQQHQHQMQGGLQPRKNRSQRRGSNFNGNSNGNSNGNINSTTLLSATSGAGSTNGGGGNTSPAPFTFGGNGNVGGALSVPGPFAHVIRKVGLSKDAVRREMVALHMQGADPEHEREMLEAEQKERALQFQAEFEERKKFVKEARRLVKAHKAALLDPGPQLRQLFDAVDGNHSGTLTRMELKSALNNVRHHKHGRDSDGSSSSVGGSSSVVGREVEGRKVKKLLCESLGIPEQIDDLEARETFEVVFDCIDTDGTHTIDLTEMTKFVKDIKRVAAMYAADFGLTRRRKARSVKKGRTEAAARRHLVKKRDNNGFSLRWDDDEFGDDEGSEGSTDSNKEEECDTQEQERLDNASVAVMHPRIRELLAMADIDRGGTLSSAEVIRIMQLHPEIREFLHESDREAERAAEDFLAAHASFVDEDDEDDEGDGDEGGGGGDDEEESKARKALNEDEEDEEDEMGLAGESMKVAFLVGKEGDAKDEGAREGEEEEDASRFSSEGRGGVAGGGDDGAGLAASGDEDDELAQSTSLHVAELVEQSMSGQQQQQQQQQEEEEEGGTANEYSVYSEDGEEFGEEDDGDDDEEEAEEELALQAEYLSFIQQRQLQS